MFAVVTAITTVGPNVGLSPNVLGITKKSSE